jgi:hypothetical protein
MIVTITQKHTIDSRYMSIRDCPLARALKAYLFDNSVVFDQIIVGSNDADICVGGQITRLVFDSKKWNPYIMYNLAKGDIEPVQLELTTSKGDKEL